jgi:hypothetical protein
LAQQDHLGRDHRREGDRDAGLRRDPVDSHALWSPPSKFRNPAHCEYGPSVRYWHSLTNVSKGGRDGETKSLKLKTASVGNRDFPAPPLTPPNNPNNIGSVNVFTDDITKINGDTNLRGEHSGFCFHVRQPNIWLCQARYTRCQVSGKGDSGMRSN